MRLLLPCLLASMVAAADYAFVVDGHPVQPTLIELAPGDVHPAPGDIAWVKRVPVVLDAPGEYRLRTTRDAVLLGEPGLAGEAPAVVAIDLGKDHAGLTGLGRDALARLRHVVVSVPDPVPADALAAVAAALGGCDAQRTVLEWRVAAYGPRPAVPAVPAGWRHLHLASGGQSGAAAHDLAGLSALRELRWLHIDGLAPALDARALAGLGALRRLECTFVSIDHAAALAGLTALTALRITFAPTHRPALDTGFLAGLRDLRRLDLSHSHVDSLATAGLPALRHLLVGGSTLRELPAAPLPALRTAEILGARVPAAERARFAAAHPHAQIIAGWRSSLAQAVAGADRLVLRSGGTCHRDPAQERVLHDSRDPAVIAAVLAAIDIDEEHSGHHCMCCGSDTIELRRGDAVLASLGVHHGVSVRWPEGPWPGDGVLTASACDRLCAWLAAHGAPGPGAELAAMRARQRAWQRRVDTCRRIAGQAVADLLLAEGTTPAQALAALTAATADADARTLLVLRLHGADRPDWSGHEPLDQVLEGDGVLPKAEALVRLLPRMAGDEEALDGLARWCFGLGLIKQVPEASRAAVLAIAAPRALADPRPDNRQLAIVELGALGRPWSIPALRDALAGVTVRTLPADERLDGANQVIFRPRAWSPPRGVSDRAAAALALGHCRDRGSRALIAAAAAGAIGADAEAFARALEWLDLPAPEPAGR